MQYAAGCALLMAMSFGTAWAAEAPAAGTSHPIVLHAAHLLEIDTGRLATPGEGLVEGERIAAAGSSVPRRRGRETGHSVAQQIPGTDPLPISAPGHGKVIIHE